MKALLRDAGIQLAVSAAAVLLALVAGAIFIAFLGKNPFAVYATLLEGSILHSDRTQWYGLGQVLYKATTLIFTGAAVALSFRTGLFNIGAEGQMYLGGFCAAVAGLYLFPVETTSAWVMPVCILAAFVGGAAGAVVPAILKATRGTHEVIVTMMMNFIIVAVVNWITGRIAEEETTHTWELPACARLSGFGPSFAGSAATTAFWYAIVAACAATWLLSRTRAGFEMRAVGFNAPAAEANGVRIRWTMCLALLLSGGLAGLGGINFVLGNKGYFDKGFTAGAGFLGIAVALLARNHPLAVVPAAFLFAVLSEGAVAVNTGAESVKVPRELFDILQAIIILFVVVMAILLQKGLAALQKRRAAGA